MCADCVAIACTAADMDSRRSAVDAAAPLPLTAFVSAVAGLSPDVGWADGRAFATAALTWALAKGKESKHGARRTVGGWKHRPHHVNPGEIEQHDTRVRANDIR